MNDERLRQIKELADKATKLAKLLEDLRLSDPFAHGNAVQFHRNGTEILATELVNKIFAEGLLKLTADFEAELENLIGHGE